MIANFAALFIAFYVGHLIGDHWVQSSRQAEMKTESPAHRFGHVATLTATKLIAVLFLLPLGLDVHPLSLVGALIGLGLTHYWIDDRNNLRKLAKLFGKEKFHDLGVPPVGTGAYQLDQSAHVLMIFLFSVALAFFGTV